MIRFSQQASDQWIQGNLCSTPPVIQLLLLIMAQTLSNTLTYSYTQKVRPDTLLESITFYLFTFEKTNILYNPTWAHETC